MESPLRLSAPEDTTLELDRPLCMADLSPHPVEAMIAAVEATYRRILDERLILMVVKVCFLRDFISHDKSLSKTWIVFGSFVQAINSIEKRQ